MTEQSVVEDSRVLVAFASMYGQTAKIAHYVADRLEERGAKVTIRDCAEIGRTFRLDDLDAAVVGGPVIRQAVHVEARRFVTDHASDLRAMPSAFFLVSGAAGSRHASERDAARAIMDRFLDHVAWAPIERVSLAGAIPYTRYPLILKWIMKWISWRNGGSTDTSRDHEYTDWEQVAAFADGVADMLATARADRACRAVTASSPKVGRPAPCARR